MTGLTLAALGILPPVLAAAGQSLPDLGILANSARLLRQGKRLESIIPVDVDLRSAVADHDAPIGALQHGMTVAVSRTGPWDWNQPLAVVNEAPAVDPATGGWNSFRPEGLDVVESQL